MNNEPKTIELPTISTNNPYLQDQIDEEGRLETERQAKIAEDARLESEAIALADAEEREKEKKAEEVSKLESQQLEKNQQLTTNILDNKELAGTTIANNKPLNDNKILEKEKEDYIVPDQLNIKIRTSIPGYQNIEYKPYMTMKDSKSNSVQFNPLLRLNKSIIDKIPKEERVKQFFNKGLFESLLIYNGGNMAKNISYATSAGYIDDNIRVTLDTIFPVNSVIYIAQKPYVIADVQWSSGDWKIEVKQKKTELDPNKITDPYLYNKLVNEEIISGEKELSNLPASVIVGNNYSGPPVNISSGLQNVPDLTYQVAEKPPKSASQEETKMLPAPKEMLPAPRKMLPAPEERKMLPAPEEIKMLPAPIKNSSEPKLLENENKVSELSSDEEEKILQNYLKIKNRQDDKKSLSENTTKNLKNYFLRRKFFNVADTIFRQFDDNIKKIIKDFYKLNTQHKIKKDLERGLNSTLYNELCNQVKVYKTVADGNCFFDAVSFGINIYNYSKPNNKIVFNEYGITKLFTIDTLRNIVWNYYNGLNQEIKDHYKTNIAPDYANDLNNLFENSIIENPIDDNYDNYMDRINVIYKSRDNFMVHKPETVPNADEKNRPFKIVDDDSQVEKYIKSKDYWGDQFAMIALCNKLKINIIPIEEKNKTSPNNKPHKDYIARSIGLVSEQEPCSEKIMFLYKEALHYELISIYYKKPVIENIVKIINVDYPIFETNNNPPPPYHMLLLLYSSIYLTLQDNVRTDFKIYPNLMKMINRSINKILHSSNNEKKQEFINNFNSIFTITGTVKNYFNIIENRSFDIEWPTQKINKTKRKKDEPSDEPSDESSLISRRVTRSKTKKIVKENSKDEQGGGYPYSYDSRIITKNPEQQNSSKIAYAITIDMELHPGTSLTPEQLEKSKCNSKYNAIRRAFSEFTGRPYVITPVYQKPETRKNTGGKRNKITRKKR